jgi:hypothetical protein
MVHRPGRTIKLSNGFRVVDSTVGPIIRGQAKKNSEELACVVSKVDAEKEEIRIALEKLWTLEGLGIMDNHQTMTILPCKNL